MHFGLYLHTAQSLHSNEGCQMGSHCIVDYLYLNVKLKHRIDWYAMLKNKLSRLFFSLFLLKSYQKLDLTPFNFLFSQRSKTRHFSDFHTLWWLTYQWLRWRFEVFLNLGQSHVWQYQQTFYQEFVQESRQ